MLAFGSGPSSMATRRTAGSDTPVTGVMLVTDQRPASPPTNVTSRGFVLIADASKAQALPRAARVVMKAASLLLGSLPGGRLGGASLPGGGLGPAFLFRCRLRVNALGERLLPGRAVPLLVLLVRDLAVDKQLGELS